MNTYTEGSAWEQCSVDDCNTSGPQEHDCCNQNSMDTVGIPTVQMDRQDCPWKSTVQPKSAWISRFVNLKNTGFTTTLKVTVTILSHNHP